MTGRWSVLCNNVLGVFPGAKKTSPADRARDSRDRSEVPQFPRLAEGLGSVGAGDGATVGLGLGASVGSAVGEGVGASVGAVVGDADGAVVTTSPPMNSVRWYVWHEREEDVDETVTRPSWAQSPIDEFQ